MPTGPHLGFCDPYKQATYTDQSGIALGGKPNEIVGEREVLNKKEAMELANFIFFNVKPSKKR